MTRRPVSATLLAIAAVALVLSLPAAAIASSATAGATPAVPSLTVAPAAQLSAGSHVVVRLRGLPAATTVQFAQCDDRFDPSNAAFGCVSGSGPMPTAQTGPAGGLVAHLTLGDPLFLAQEFGDAIPVYCRADQCRLFAVWTDASGQVLSLSSQRLFFLGSPATINAQPATDLVDGQRVQVNGTAVGATGRRVVIVEEDCFAIIQGSGCDGSITLGSRRVDAHGRWQLAVKVPRVLPDGVDCSHPDDFIFDSICQLTAHVLTCAGQPDDTFGVARIGQPAARLSFLLPAS